MMKKRERMREIKRGGGEKEERERGRERGVDKREREKRGKRREWGETHTHTHTHTEEGVCVGGGRDAFMPISALTCLVWFG